MDGPEDLLLTRYDLLVFDFDGTLVDTAPDIAHHANAVLKSLGLPERSFEDVKRATGRGVHALFEELGLERGERLERAVALMRESYASDPVIHSRIYPHVEAMLEGPLKSVKKAVVTNKLLVLTEKILERLSLRRHFDLVIGEGSGFPRKPDPSSVRAAMERLGASPARTLFIGDSDVDRQTAENAGTGFVWVEWGYDSCAKNAARCADAKAWKDFIIS